ncbi:hypothetical protein [Algoriphagus persicinus]|uniref:hypothetical protein n=1 Tax=Algoriphagus persicinus TaxID=3108754 RepID=UPI002B3AF753|nr:hypothetical protein [Algoriphagus sp. E1-3-M2]MEB2784878.1 hypothetical protein [Algoriphagus sp. E1-3-M2]
MDAYKFSQVLIRINELIESGNIKDAEQSLIQLEEELVKDDSLDELNRLTIFWEKIEKYKKSEPNFSSTEQSENDLLSLVVTGQKVQNETLKSIEGYLKFFFWLAVIGLILIVFSLFL